MTHFSLAHLTVLSVPPPEMIRMAARTGYQTVGLRLIRVTDTTPGYPLMDDPAMLRDTLAAIRDTGVGVLDIEFVQIRPETEIQSLLPFLETGAALGAKWIVAAPYDADLGRLADRFAILCDLAAPFGMRVALEFFPWTVVPGIAEADAILDAANRPNSGILVDTLHFNRGPSTLEALAVIRQERLPFLHLCDAPVAPSWTTEELLHAARAERLAPGDGGIDLPSLIAAMPHGIPLALEVPMTALTTRIGPEGVAQQIRIAAERVTTGVRC